MLSSQGSVSCGHQPNYQFTPLTTAEVVAGEGGIRGKEACSNVQKGKEPMENKEMEDSR